MIDLDDLAGRVITFTLEKPTDLDRYTIKIFDLDGGLIHAEDWAGAADPTARVTVPEGAAAIEIEGLYANPFTFQFGADGNLNFSIQTEKDYFNIIGRSLGANWLKAYNLKIVPIEGQVGVGGPPIAP